MPDGCYHFLMWRAVACLLSAALAVAMIVNSSSTVHA
jgi:hypothetical protein